MSQYKEIKKQYKDFFYINVFIKLFNSHFTQTVGKPLRPHFFISHLIPSFDIFGIILSLLILVSGGLVTIPSLGIYKGTSPVCIVCQTPPPPLLLLISSPLFSSTPPPPSPLFLLHLISSMFTPLLSRQIYIHCLLSKQIYILETVAKSSLLKQKTYHREAPTAFVNITYQSSEELF